MARRGLLNDDYDDDLCMNGSRYKPDDHIDVVLVRVEVGAGPSRTPVQAASSTASAISNTTN